MKFNRKAWGAARFGYEIYLVRRGAVMSQKRPISNHRSRAR